MILRIASTMDIFTTQRKEIPDTSLHYFLVVPAYEWLSHSSVPTGVPSSSLCDPGGAIMLGNVGIFLVFIGVLPLSQFNPPSILHFSIQKLVWRTTGV